MKPFGRTFYKLTVAVAVKGIDVLKVDVQAVVVLCADAGDDIIKKPRLHAFVGEHRVGKVGGKAARPAEVRDGQKRRGLARVRRFDQLLVRDGVQLPLGGDAVGEGAERGKVRHGLRQHRCRHRGVDIGVDLDLLAHVLGGAGDHQALPDHEARGVRNLVEALEVLHGGAELSREGVETVPRFDNSNLHKRESSFPKQAGIMIIA